MKDTSGSAAPRLSQNEFIALIAVLFATIAFSIDSMLPALPVIAGELSPEFPNQAQFIIISFVFGMGVGTFLVGPVSDALGRKPVIVGGAVLYCIGAALAWAAPTLETMIIARVIQGLGASGPRVVALAMVRDLYKGREMARVVSFAMMIFTLIPAVAPLIGSFIIADFGWRAIFVAFLLFSLVSTVWLMLRQPETLAPENRRPLRLTTLLNGLVEVLSHRTVVLSILVQALVFGGMFASIASIQQVFEQYLGRGEEFPYWFALIALMSGLSSVVNAKLVVRLGMRYLITAVLASQVVFSLIMAVMTGFDLWPDWMVFPSYIIWTTTVFFMMGMTGGNLNALALEPVGHVAGMAASIVGSLSTVLAVALAAPIGLAFDGTPEPLAIGIAVATMAASVLMRMMPR